MLNKLLLEGQMFLSSDTGRVFSKLVKSVDGLRGGLKSLGTSIAVLMCIVLGISWMGGRSGAQWAKSELVKVVCGVSIIVLAVDVIGFVIGVFD